jgi:predicted DNA binding CopG/RHH family protein
VALTSEVTHLKDHNLKLLNNAKPIKSKNSGDTPKKSGKGKKPSKKSADEEKWAKIPDFDKIHHCCEYHQACVVHTPASCTVRISHEEAEAAHALAASLEESESDE